MFSTEDSTFRLQLFIRTFSFSNRTLSTEETISLDNVEFESKDTIIKYTNI